MARIHTEHWATIEMNLNSTGLMTPLITPMQSNDLYTWHMKFEPTVLSGSGLSAVVTVGGNSPSWSNLVGSFRCDGALGAWYDMPLKNDSNPVKSPILYDLFDGLWVVVSSVPTGSLSQKGKFHIFGSFVFNS